MKIKLNVNIVSNILITTIINMSTLLPLEKKLRILGVTFNTHFIFSPHIDSIITRPSSRIKIHKVLAGTSWGQQN